MKTLCTRCAALGTAWRAETGSPLKCAFTIPIRRFQSDNYNCATMNELRKLAENVRVHHDDHSAVFLRVPHGTEQDNDTLYVVLAWYKDRGCCDFAQEIQLGPDGRLVEGPLSLRTAELVLDNPKLACSYVF